MSISFNPDGSGAITAPNGETKAFGSGVLPGDIASMKAAFEAENQIPTPATDPFLISAIKKLVPSTSPTPMGSVTMVAAPTTTVVQPAIQANGIVVLTPLNSDAANLRWYISSLTPNAGFTIAVASGSALGTEIFAYAVLHP